MLIATPEIRAVRRAFLSVAALLLTSVLACAGRAAAPPTDPPDAQDEPAESIWPHRIDR